MTKEILPVDQIAAAARGEVQLLLSVAESTDPASPVPMCPGWTLADMVMHLGGVFRWVNVVVSEGRAQPPVGDERRALFTDPDPDDVAGVIKRLREASAAILESLEQAPEDLACWTIWAGGAPREFWWRRMLHEVVVHRVDAENARSGSPDPGSGLDTAVAADGVDEMMLGFAGRYAATLRADQPFTLAVEATDVERAWWTRIGPDAPAFGRGAAAADAVIRGRAGELLLLLWNRRDAVGLELTGRQDALEIWRSGAHL